MACSVEKNPKVASLDVALHFLAILVQLRGLLCADGDGHANGYCHSGNSKGWKNKVSCKKGPLVICCT